MTVSIQHTSNSTEQGESASETSINANLHFSVSEALTESNLLERVREFRRLSLEVACVNSELTEQQLAQRAQVMLQLKEASEKFNTLLHPVDELHLQVLRELKLEQILSTYYWHSLFLANNHPEQGKYELDSLCSKLLNAKYSLSVVGGDVVNSAIEIDADVHSNSNHQRVSATEFPSISRKVLTAVAPKSSKFTAVPKAIDETSGDKTTRESQTATVQPGSAGALVSGLVIGLCVLLLTLLAASIFFPNLVQKLQAFMAVGSTPLRMIMLGLLIVLTTSFYILISRLTNTKKIGAVSAAKVKTELFTGLFAMGASPRRLFAASVAPILFGLGLGVATSAGFGSFGFAMLLDGLNNVLLAPLWLLLPAITICCCLLAWLWARVSVGWGTLIALLLIGPAIGIGAEFAPVDTTLAGDISTLILGLILFSGGIALSAAAAVGPDGMTALSLAAERADQWPISLTVVLWDLTAIAAGVILGGSVGIATVIGLLAVPFLIRLFLPAFRRVVV